jgi:hypothetical protein
MFKDWRTNVHNEEQSGQPSVVSDDRVRSVDQKICERWHFTISKLSCEFPQNRTQSRGLTHQYNTSALFQRIAINIAGPLPESKGETDTS